MEGIKYEIMEDTPFHFQNITEKPPIINSNEQSTTNKNDNSINNIELRDFEMKIKKYVDNNKLKVYILTPCYNGSCNIDYVNCLLNTFKIFKQFNIDITVEFCKNDSLVPRARNNLVAKAMADKEMTHIIFIDSDISWDPLSILKLLIADKHIIGGVYPLKHYCWDKLIKDQLNPYNSNIVNSWIEHKKSTQLKDSIPDELYVQNKLLLYNVNYLDNYLNIDNNIAKVKHTATGFMMIKRSVFENMFKAFPSTKYVDDVHFLQQHENEYAYAIFDCGVEEGHYFSEDWMFCHRWQKLGGEVFIDVSINLNHSGIEEFKGSYVTSLI